MGVDLEGRGRGAEPLPFFCTSELTIGTTQTFTMLNESATVE